MGYTHVYVDSFGRISLWTMFAIHKQVGYIVEDIHDFWCNDMQHGPETMGLDHVCEL